MILQWLATTGYGLESVTARELKALGAEQVEPQTSRVLFRGDWAMGARANLWLRSAGRVRLVVGQFPARTFDELYENTQTLPWQDWMGRDSAYPVTARAVSSALMSPPDIQAIVKKAVSARLGKAYGLARLPESGVAVPIEAHIHKDNVTLSLDTTGTPLHMRGYRKLNGPAALRETLAASLVLLTKWQGDRPLADPFCGTGTIAIEAALYARNMAPGIHRVFQAEKWGFADGNAFIAARQEAKGQGRDIELDILASDIDDEALSMAQYHAKRAGVEGDIRLKKADIRKFSHEAPQGHIITNPPYGTRLGDEKQARELCEIMGRRFGMLPGWGVHIISSDQEFERYYGRRAMKKRELRNGNLACRYYEYF